MGAWGHTCDRQAVDMAFAGVCNDRALGVTLSDCARLPPPELHRLLQSWANLRGTGKVRDCASGNAVQAGGVKTPAPEPMSSPASEAASVGDACLPKSCGGAARKWCAASPVSAALRAEVGQELAGVSKVDGVEAPLPPPPPPPPRDVFRALGAFGQVIVRQVVLALAGVATHPTCALGVPHAEEKPLRLPAAARSAASSSGARRWKSNACFVGRALVPEPTDVVRSKDGQEFAGVNSAVGVEVALQPKAAPASVAPPWVARRPVAPRCFRGAWGQTCVRHELLAAFAFAGVQVPGVVRPPPGRTMGTSGSSQSHSTNNSRRSSFCSVSLARPVGVFTKVPALGP
mmetsp:Transcript_9792/g.28432  ORF Transcript_9792/g.28432 Transcript_9792/m.28432 type:complete len:345 (+) Transcript_9792:2029-3063(+)